jgi:hypothetical protein
MPPESLRSPRSLVVISPHMPYCRGVGDVAASPLSGDPMQALLAFLWSEPWMGSPLKFLCFPLATFAGAFIAGLSGFAFGLVAASLWLYILTPLQSATLISGALDWQKLWPFVVGAAFWRTGRRHASNLVRSA